ncbi:MAG: FAD-dependent oxidoreductase [Candidatus Rokubacteria bacterium]|nr:FAD-dependent oxidoreductase [Candidatus Rokubacteria bacterium]
MARRHLIVGGGTAGINAIRTIREEESERSEITLVSAEKPYSRMVLPYFLDRSIAESHVYTATAKTLADWGVKTLVGRKAASLDTKANVLTLDDGAKVEYDDCLVATGSSPVRAPLPGADGAGVHSFWTLDQAKAVIDEIRKGSHVVMFGAGFISFTILNSILSLGAKLTIVEIAPTILPRMVDATGAALVQQWLERHGVTVRTGATATGIEDVPMKGKPPRKRVRFKAGADVVCDVVIMATGIKTNLDWLEDSGLRIDRGIVVNDRLRSNVDTVYAAGDVAEGPDVVTGGTAVHAIEPTAQEHGRVAGANMAGKDVAYRGSLLANIVEVQHLDVASFGAWDDEQAEAITGLKADRPAYRKLLFTGGRLTGAIILGPSSDIWTTNDVGMLKGLVQAGVTLDGYKGYLRKNPFDVKTAYIATRTTATLLPQTVRAQPAYAGTLLRVDLSRGRVKAEPWTPDEMQELLGGVGLGAMILYRETGTRGGKGNASWDHPDNRLVLATGPLAGLPVWGSSGLTVVTIGAMTNGPTSTQANGFFGTNLKYSGYDAIVIQGQAKDWVYLYIDGDTVELRDARDLLGKDTWDTQDTLSAKLGFAGHQLSVYSIGPAGEHLVRFAAIQGDYGHVASKNGAGAVMGKKKLKAVAIVRGPKALHAADPRGVVQAADDIAHDLKTDPLAKSLYEWGTLTAVVGLSRLGALPIKNYTTSVPHVDMAEWDAPKLREGFDPACTTVTCRWSGRASARARSSTSPSTRAGRWAGPSARPTRKTSPGSTRRRTAPASTSTSSAGSAAGSWSARSVG